MPREHCGEHFRYEDFCPQCRRENGMPARVREMFPQPPPPLGKDALDVVAEAARGRMHRAEGLLSPREFLLRAPLAVIQPSLTPAELEVVIRYRSS